MSAGILGTNVHLKGSDNSLASGATLTLAAGSTFYTGTPLASLSGTDLKLVATGTNQNVTLTPVGTGIVQTSKDILSTDNAAYSTWQGDAITGRGIFAQRASSISGIYTLSLAHNTQWIGYRAEGTFGAITATAANGNMLSMLGGGYNGSAWVYPASITLTAAENFTGSVNGSFINFATTIAGGVTTASMRLSSAGNLLVGTSSDTGITGAGGLKINNAVMIATETAFTNGAGSSAGTLTNAPAIGNPTKWIPVYDAGTTRYIPAW